MPSPKTLVEYPSDREMVFTRLFDAPRELVWEAWTNPKHVVNWWGPRGFTNTIHEMNVQPGGVWRLTMHGPDRTDYPNRIEFIEVVKPERLVYHHGDDGDPRRFHVTTHFTADGNRTKVVSRMRFRTADECAATKRYAVDGHNSTMERLGEHLANMGAGGKPFTISREFKAPRDLVFKVWTEREHLLHWWGPKGVKVVSCTNDFRPGGAMHYCMRTPDGEDMWGKWVYRDILPPQRLVWVNSFSDPAGNVIHYPTMTTWPREMLTTVTFTENNGRTTVAVQFVALNPTAAEQKTFDDNHASMQGGWTGTFEQLDAYLPTAAKPDNPAEAEREIVSSRLLAAPPVRVFEAFSDPKQLALWWGPKGFTNTIHEFDLRPGGKWSLDLHAPNGANYHNEKTFLEVAKPGRIVFEHVQPMHTFTMAMHFADQGGKTKLTWRMLFDSAAECAKVKDFILPANEENFDRLEAHLAKRDVK